MLSDPKCLKFCSKERLKLLYRDKYAEKYNN